jgi:hypothetical protein
MKLGDDERAQSVLVGAILLFAILTVTFSSYQAFVVPNQNAEVEFNHNQRVQNDMVEIRNELLSTYTTGQNGYAEIELGTQYPPRLLALNPPAPSGTFQTGPSRPIVVETQSGTDITDEVLPGDVNDSRTVSYTPTYSEYNNAGTLRYENSVAYHDFGDSFVPLTDQQLVRDNTIQIVPVPTRFDENGRRAVAIEPRAGLTDRTTREDINVTLPTELSESQWEALLSDELDPANVTVTDGPRGRNLTLTLDDEWAIDAGPVGLGSTPGSPRGGGVDEINPAAPGDIILESESASGSTVTLTFNNTAAVNNFTRGRINFYNTPGNNPPTEAIVRVAGQPDSATLLIGGNYEQFDPDLTIGGETTTNVEMEFDKNPSSNAWFVATFQLETGETAVYFVGL